MKETDGNFTEINLFHNIVIQTVLKLGYILEEDFIIWIMLWPDK